MEDIVITQWEDTVIIQMECLTGKMVVDVIVRKIDA